MAVRSVTIALLVTASRMLRSGVSVKRIGVRTAIGAATPGALALPSAAIAQNDGTMSGVFTDTSQRQHGFWLRQGTFHQVDVPGARNTDVACISDRSGLLVGGYQVRGQSRFTGFTDQHGVFRSLRDPSATLGTLPQCGNDGGRVAGFYITQIGHMSVTRGFRFAPGTLSGAASESGQRGPGVLQTPVSPRLGRP
jgi:hypothetical protein